MKTIKLTKEEISILRYVIFTYDCQQNEEDKEGIKHNKILSKILEKIDL
jgi:hypothetical protein